MRDPSQYGAAVIACQTGVTIVYSIIGCVVYYYCGTYVSSPALGSAGGVIKIISYAFALPGLLVTMTIVTHVSLYEPFPTENPLIIWIHRFPQSTSLCMFSAAPDTSLATAPPTGSPGSPVHSVSPLLPGLSPVRFPSSMTLSLSLEPC